MSVKIVWEERVEELGVNNIDSGLQMPDDIKNTQTEFANLVTKMTSLRTPK